MPELPQTPDTHDDFQERLAAALERPQQRKEGGPAPSAEPQPEAAASAGPVGQGNHVVKQGECLSSIAKKMGYSWETIWNDSANAILREVRKDPNVLLPGDRIAVPAKLEKREAKPTEARHRFIRKGEPAFLRLKLLKDGEPRANEEYRLQIGSETRQGAFDPEGKLKEQINGDTERVKLFVGKDYEDEYDIELGDLSPAEGLRGVQERLNNLGFYAGKADGKWGRRTRAGLNRFREAIGLPPLEDFDASICETLRRMHDEMQWPSSDSGAPP